MFTQQIKERDSIPGAPIWPQSVNNTTVASGTIDMSKFNRCSLFGLVGTGAGTVRAYLQETANSNGAGATNVAGAIISNIANTVNSAFTIELYSSQLTKRYVKAVIEEVAVVAVTVSGVFIGTEARYKPANGFDVNTVLERAVSTV